MKLLVLADGTVGSVEILSSRPEGVFEESVKKIAPRWKFQPGVIDGRNVPAWVVTTVTFVLDR